MPGIRTLHTATAAMNSARAATGAPATARGPEALERAGEALVRHGFGVISARDVGLGRRADPKELRRLLDRYGLSLPSVGDGSMQPPDIRTCRARASVEGGRIVPERGLGEGEVHWPELLDGTALRAWVEAATPILQEAALRQKAHADRVTLLVRRYVFEGVPGHTHKMPAHRDPYSMTMMSTLHAHNVDAINHIRDDHHRVLGTGKIGDVVFLDNSRVLHDVWLSSVTRGPSERFFAFLGLGAR